MLNTYIINIKNWILKNKIFFSICIILALLVLIFTILPKKQPIAPHSTLETTISPSLISKDSSVILTKNTSLISLQSYNSYFYKTKSTSLAAAKEFISQNPTYNSQPIIPENFSENGPLLKTVKDNEDPFSKKNITNPTTEHYTFGQEVDKIPVFSAELKIHLRNENEIYSVQSNLINNFQIKEQKLSEQTAKNIATVQAQKDAPKTTPLVIENAQKYILNKKILGENDETNYLTLAVTIKNAENSTSTFSKQYFIDLNSGAIVYQINLIKNAQNRKITNSTGGAGRSEGQPAVGGNVDTLYNYMGKTYDFYFNNFQRDGWDGKGGQEKATLSPPCSSASSGGGQIDICSDYLVEHVVAHEATHAISYYMGILQSGGLQTDTLNEATSDVMANFITGQWHGGVNSIIRDASNPKSTGNPEKLFSANWSCGSEEHENLTVVSHAVYLMSVGGSENGCTITAIGNTNAAKIQYQAMTKYLGSTSNYKDYYTAMTNACNDLFQQGSATCTAVQAALLATELDQQPAGSQTGPKCSSGTEKQPACPAPIAVNISTAPNTNPPNSIPPTTTNITPSNPTFFPLGPNPTSGPTSVTALPPTTPTSSGNSIIPPANPPNNLMPTTIINIPNNGGNGGTGNRGSIIQFILLLLSFLLSLFGFGNLRL